MWLWDICRELEVSEDPMDYPINMSSVLMWNLSKFHVEPEASH